MKSEEDVRMIAAETPLMFSKAIEMLIHELTIKATFQAEKCDRRTTQRKDIAVAIGATPTFDFLIDTIPRDEFLTHVPPETLTPYQSSLLNRDEGYFQPDGEPKSLI